MKSQIVVRDVTVSTIKPSEATEHVKSIQPTFQDLITSNVFLSPLFVYRLENSESEYQNFVSRVKSSLEKVLVPFFPFAGRWKLDGGLWTVDGRRGWLLDCNDEGVPFIEAYVDKDIDAVVRAGGGFEPVPELNGHEILGMDSSVFKQKMQPYGLPPIFIQLTRFRCGGVALVASFLHLHYDGNSFFEFMKSWAEMAKTGNCTIVPRVDRELATTWENFVSELNEDEVPLLRNMLRMDGPCGTKMHPSVEMRVYEVNDATIKEVKKSAKSNSATQFVSTNDCVLAALWKLSSSLPAALTAEKPTGVLHLAEGRNRYCNPPMPHLVGNVFAATMCPMPPSAEVVKVPLHTLSENIRTNLTNTDWNNLFNVDSARGMLMGFSGDYIRLWLNTSWSKFAVYDLDFGVCTPYFVPGINGSHDWGVLGASLVLPPAPGHASSAATVSLYTAPEILDFMESLPEFWDFFLPREHTKNTVAPHETSSQADLESPRLPWDALVIAQDVH